MCELRKRVGDAEQLHCEAEDDGKKKKKKLTLTSVTKLENRNKCVVNVLSIFTIYLNQDPIQSNTSG